MIIDTRIKFSPKSLEDFIFPNDEVCDLVTAYASGKLTRPLLLYGGNGTGKSLLQRLIPNAIESKEAKLNCVRCADLQSAAHIHDLYGRNKYFDRNFVIDGQRFNYYIYEEFLLTKRALNDALKTELDDTFGTDLTILSTNFLTMVDAGIVSRCEVLHVPACKPDQFFPHAKKIIGSVGVDFDDRKLFDCLSVVYSLNPDNRKYYSALDGIIRSSTRQG